MGDHLVESISGPSQISTQISSQINSIPDLSSPGNFSSGSRSNSTDLTPSQPIPKKSQQIKTDKPRPHICTTCTRAFARLEHLKRHERSHTNEKPFQCAACGRCFARRDLVLRHQQKLHTDLPNIMRRNSRDGTDGPNLNNEHIIVLPNNTEPNAALPDSSASVTPTGAPPAKKQKPLLPHHKSISTPSRQFRNSVFSDNKNLFPRHSSFSAASSSYSNFKDSFNMIKEEDLDLGHVDMNFDWHGLDLASQHHNPTNGHTGHEQDHFDYNQLLFKKDFLDSNTNFYQNPKMKNLKDQSLEYENVQSPQGGHLHYESPNSKPEKQRKYEESPNKSPPRSMSISGHKSSIDSFPQGFQNFGIDIDIQKPNNLTPNSVPNSSHTPASTRSHKGNQIHNLNSNSPNYATTTSGNERESIPDQGDWLQEIINTPYDPVFSHQDLSPASPKNVDEITSLFKTRQLDLSKHFQMDGLAEMHDIPENDHMMGVFDNGHSGIQMNGLQEPHHSNNPQDQNVTHQEQHGLDANLQHSDKQLNLNHLNLDSQNIMSHDVWDNLGYFKVKDGRNKAFICEELRDKIMVMSNLSDTQFPNLEELNGYMKLYEKEFNKYFPFIHLPSLKNPMVDKFENIPLLLAMASIGALYSYNDATTLMLFNLSKFHIQNFFEKEVTLDNLQFKKVPLMAHQCLVLHIFISMFLNEPPMVEITSRQMKSMVGLIKSTNFHKQLDKFLVPPVTIIHPKAGSKTGEVEYSHDPGLVQTNFDYFIMAQSRIRTIQVFYMLQQFRTSTFIDSTILLSSSGIVSGNHCQNEDLWKCENSNQWLDELIKLGNKTSVTDLSNNGSMKDLIDSLNDFKPKSMNFNNLLCLLMHTHEKIQEQYVKMKQQLSSHPHNQVSNFLRFDFINWKLNSQTLDDLIKSWEMNFVKNGGSLVINEKNDYLLNEHSELKLILPLYHLAKIKVAVNLTPIIERIVYKDWENMNKFLNCLHVDFEGLKQLIEYSLDIMELWNRNIYVVNNSNENNLRTPVFFVTCVFVSLLLISQFLYYIEQINDKDNGISLGLTEKILWLKCEKVLKNCEKIIALNYPQKNPFMEEYENYESIRKLIETNSNSKLIVNSLKLIKLSNKCLFLGVRILADAPIWPLVMGFAEALKNRANYISKT